ncbi:MAG: iron-sulfur cluster repair di-iron protein [Clostridiales bacterium GWB2_37_7]|nr:MAG: iron-sulfur cluster repair di-iron protein [Clostridiales bacterium GWB2_37_7]
MNHIFSSADTIGNIVVNFPKAIDTFKEYNIDFCCGGHRPLAEALKEQNLSEATVIDKLNEEYESFKDSIHSEIDWRTASYSQLIDYIVQKHHTYLQNELPALGQLVSKILRVHGEHHIELTKVHKLFNSLRTELESHLIKEEEILFPKIKQYEKDPSPELLNKALKTITELENEHTGAGDVLKELRRITDQYMTPPDGCTTYSLTYQKLYELESDLFQHIHMENNILFPRLQALKGAHTH